MNARQELYIALPVIAVVVLLLTYFRLLSSTVVIVVILVLYIAVSIRNRRKFKRQEVKQSRP